jgi:hypothetical protein
VYFPKLLASAAVAGSIVRNYSPIQ